MITDAEAAESFVVPLIEATPWDSWLARSTPSTLRPIYRHIELSNIDVVHNKFTNLVLEIIPPVRPRLLNAALFFEDSSWHDGCEYTVGHSHAMVIIAMHADTLLEFCQRATIYFEAIVKLLGLNTKLGYIMLARDNRGNNGAG
jgi:hypothetical protein